MCTVESTGESIGGSISVVIICKHCPRKACVNISKSIGSDVAGDQSNGIFFGEIMSDNESMVEIGLMSNELNDNIGIDHV